MTRERSLVQAVELWLPQGEVMALSAGAYRNNAGLAQDSTQRSFQYGEGLPGAVWANRQARLIKDLAEPFVRTELAAEAGIDAALGFPLFDGERLLCVVTLLLSRNAEAPGCLEVWDVNEELGVLRFGSGYYVHCPELERFSPHIQFQRGTGLPGLTWLAGQVEVMDDVRKSSSFIRAGLAERCGLRNGIGIPIYRDRSVLQVLTLFGSEGRSLITSTELYHPRGTELGAGVMFDWSRSGTPNGESVADAPGRKLAANVLSRRAPMLVQAKTSDREITLGLPLYDRKGLKQVLVLRT